MFWTSISSIGDALNLVGLGMEVVGACTLVRVEIWSLKKHREDIERGKEEREKSGQEPGLHGILRTSYQAATLGHMFIEFANDLLLTDEGEFSKRIPYILDTRILGFRLLVAGFAFQMLGVFII